MKPTLEQFFALLDVLRLRRSAPTWRAEEDREVLAQLDDWYKLLSEEEQDAVEQQGDRAWPAPDALFDQNLDAAEVGSVDDPPRIAEAA